VRADGFFDVGQSRALAWARRAQAAALVAELADPDRGWDAIVIGEYERAFYGGQYASMAPLSEHYGIQLWTPEVGGRIEFHAEDHEQTMLALGLQSKREVTRTRIRVRTALAAKFLPLCAAHCALRCDSVRTWNGRQRNPLIAGSFPGSVLLVDGALHRRAISMSAAVTEPRSVSCARVARGTVLNGLLRGTTTAAWAAIRGPHGEDQGPQGCTADLSAPPRAIRGGPRHRGTVRTGAGPSDPHAR
jgi:hypothetical protein